MQTTPTILILSADCLYRLQSSAFCRKSRKACKVRNTAPYYRGYGRSQNAVCAAAEAAYEIRSSVANIPQGIKSENTDGYSVTYKDYDVDELKYKEQNAMLAAIRQELSGTGLLYQGVC